MKRALAAALMAAALAYPLACEASGSKTTKDETVYAVLDPSGAVKSISVSDWLHREGGSGAIRDRSDLGGIENVKGRETPRRDGNDIVWDAKGNDVYYRGTSSKSLPFSVRVSYWLDDKRIEPAALAGKGGTVRIRVEVKNLAPAKAGGLKETQVRAPLAVIVGAALPSSVFSDIEVKGGRILSDGQSAIVAGFLMPGLLESIEAASSGEAASGLEKIPEGIKSLVPGESLEIKAKTAKFSFGSFMVAATPDLGKLAGQELGEARGNLEAALGGLGQLADASGQLRDGSAALAAGAAQLHEGIATAAGAMGPLLASDPDVDMAKAFIASDQDIQAARDLLAAGRTFNDSGPELKALAAELLDPASKARVAALLADAKGLDMKSLLDLPLASKAVSEESIAAIAELLKASDDLYSSFDEGKMAAIADFAAGNQAFLSATKSFCDASTGYDPAAGAAIANLASARPRLESARAQAAKRGPVDAAALASGLSASAMAQADLYKASAFLEDDAKAQALQDKLASGASLDADERTQLASLLAAATKDRAALDSGSRTAAQAAAALPSLGAAADMLPLCADSAAAAESLRKSALPALESARSAGSANQAALKAATKLLDSRTLNAISTNVRKIGEEKKAYDKNKSTMKLARGFLALKAKEGGFKAQMAKIEAVQKDAMALQPLLDKAQAAMRTKAAQEFLGPDGRGERLALLMSDIERLSPYFELSEKALSEPVVAKTRELIARLPELESGVRQLDEGSATLAEKMGELSAGMKQFDREGVAKITEELGGVGSMALGYLKASEAVATASKDYKIFTLAPRDAATSLKFILRTEEIK